VAKSDEHCEKIASQKKTLLALAQTWVTQGHITPEARDEMTAIVTMAKFPEWRPLVFVIPFEPVRGRVKEVVRSKRASSEPEYIIEDLARAEFDLLELPS